MMKNFDRLFFVVVALLLFSCVSSKEDSTIQVVTPQQVSEALRESSDLQLVDVRTVEEYMEGHLPNAQNICVASEDFESKVKLLDKNKPVYLYCRKGPRSAAAAAMLKEMGFTKVYDMQGGITYWEDQGLPLAH